MTVSTTTLLRSRLRAAALLSAPLAALLAATLGAASARALTLNWTNFGSGAFNDPANYFPGVAPGPNDFVSFQVGWGAPYTVTFPGNTLVDPTAAYYSSHLWVRDSDLTFAGSTQAFKGPSTYTVTSSTETEINRGIIIGVLNGDDAQLTLANTRVVCCGGLTSVTGTAATIADGADSAGRLNVNGSSFNITGSDFTQRQMIVGNHGVGEVHVTGGGGVNVTGFNSTTAIGNHADGVGLVRISGAGSTWTNRNQFWVGVEGAGSLLVENGGSLNTSSPAGFSNVLGVFSGSTGTATITGAGSTWTNSNQLRIGGSGDGSLTIANGGALNHTDFITPIMIESPNGSSATITGAGSSMTTEGSLYVGSTGKGSLAVLSGGTLTTGRALIRGLNSGAGEALVSGPGSTWNVTRTLEIGMPEPGFTTGATKLTINPGATVNVGEDVDLDANSLLKLAGGTLTARSIRSNDLVSLQYEGAFDWTAGTLHVGTVYGDVTNQGGRLAPGVSAGRTTIAGDYVQLAAATMAMEIGGLTPEAEHDFVYLEGLASLGGLLELKLINGFTPGANDTFTLLESVGGITGAFSNVASGERLTTADGFGSFQVDYGAGSPFDPSRIVLSNFQATAPGDFNNDGQVNGDDLDAWQNGFESQGEPGDLNRVVDGADFLAWQRNYSGGNGGSPTIKAVPEPATIMLACVTALGLIASRRANLGSKP